MYTQFNQVDIATQNGSRVVAIEGRKVFMKTQTGDNLEVLGVSVPDSTMSFRAKSGNTVKIKLTGTFDADYVNTLMNCVSSNKERILVEFASMENLDEYNNSFGQLFEIGGRLFAYKY